MLAFLLLAAASDPATAEDALNSQRREVRTLTEMDCPRPGEGEEIVVCGRRSADQGGRSGFRVPYQPEPARRVAGEANYDGGGCMRLCHQPVGVDLLKIPGAAKKVIDYFSRDD